MSLVSITLFCSIYFRGTFVEFRKGLINICPVGRSCTQAERDQFAVYDQVMNSIQLTISAYFSAKEN